MVDSLSLIVYKSFHFIVQSSPFGGQIQNPGPSFVNPTEGISRVMIFGIRFALIIGAILVLIYLLWGALDWITSGGDQEQLAKARQKLTNAVIGVLILVVAIGIFFVISDDVLGIIQRGPDGSWRFGLPVLRGDCIPDGNSCTVGTSNCCNVQSTCKVIVAGNPAQCLP